MSVNNQYDQQNQEIDLGMVFKKVGNFFEGVAMAIFKGILFVKKNSIILVSLILIGFGLGFYLDKATPYEHEIIVAPNIGGTDYLYSKIKLLSSKLEEHDLQFLSSIGIKNPQKIVLIEIEPIIDIYSFVNNSSVVASNTQKFELFKLLAEGSDINKVIKDKVTSKNYPNHKIHIVTTSKTSNSEIITPLLKFLNTDEYLNKIVTISEENLKNKMKKNEELIAQTDSLIRILTNNLSKNQKGANLVYNNENNQFNSFFELKNNLINEIANQRIQLVNSNKIVKNISTVINIKDQKGIDNKLKLIFPALFILLFILTRVFLAFYSNQQKKYNFNKQ